MIYKNELSCMHNEFYTGTPQIVESKKGGAGINRLTIRQPLECCECGKFFYRWSHYNEDESTVAIRED